MDDAVLALRRFNRFYTRFLGVLDPHYLGTDLSLAEARMLYEIADRDAPLARELQEGLGLDPGYASRIVKRFEAKRWITRGRGDDARRRPIKLADAGRAAFADLDRRQREALEARIADLPECDRSALAHALDGARGLLDGARVEWTLRPFRTGDMGLLGARQAVIYAEANGWGAPMEALILDVCAQFLRDFQPGLEECWIAERAGRMLGSVFVTDGGDGIAKLRLLYVEPDARGLGIGRALVERCVEFARAQGYRRITLWTHTVLASARRIYASLGFELIATEVHHHFGKPEQGETWELALDA